MEDTKPRKRHGLFQQHIESLERREARFDRLFRRLDERHERVRAIYALECGIKALPFQFDLPTSLKTLEPVLEQFSPREIGVVRPGLISFLVERERGRTFYHILEEEIWDDHEGLKIVIPPEMVGLQFFKDVTEEDPWQTVQFSYEDGCFQLHFEDSGDYESFIKTVMASFNGSQKRDTSEGKLLTFNMTLGDVTGQLSIVVTNAHQTRRGRNATTIHEIQHLIHHVVLSLFETIEQRSDQSTTTEDGTKIRGIKDELLAFARENITGRMFIQKCFPSYFTKFGLKKPPVGSSDESSPEQDAPTLLGHSQHERTTIKHDIRIIARTLEGSFLRKMGARGRAFLVSHLYDIPLDRFPAWIDLLDRYYKEREQRVFDYLKQTLDATSEQKERTRVETIWNTLRRRGHPYQECVLGVTEQGDYYDWYTELPRLIEDQKAA